jgi:hypothetical protein
MCLIVESKLLLWEQFFKGELAVHLVAYVSEQKAERPFWQVLVGQERLPRVRVQKSVDRVA